MNPKCPWAVKTCRFGFTKPWSAQIAGFCSRPCTSCLFTITGNRGNSFGLEIDFSNHVVFRIGYVQRGSVKYQALRVVERRCSIITISLTNFTASDDIEQLAIEIGDDNAVVIAVGNEQTISRFIREDLAWEFEWCFFDVEFFQFETNRSFIEKLLLAVVRNYLVKKLGDVFRSKFAAVPRDKITFRIDDPNGWPTVYPECLPNLVIIVIDHRMNDFITQNRFANIL